GRSSLCDAKSSTATSAALEASRTFAQMYRFAQATKAIESPLLAEQRLDLGELVVRERSAVQQALHEQGRLAVEDIADQPFEAHGLVVRFRDERIVEMSAACLRALDVALLLEDAHDRRDARIRELALRPQRFDHLRNGAGTDPPDHVHHLELSGR